MKRQDANTFPAELYEAALGERCAAEIRQAKPAEMHEAGLVRDRFAINAGALTYWLYLHFQINVFSKADDEAFVADPLRESIRVHSVEYHIPHWCYLSTDLEHGDGRPYEWKGIPPP